MTDSGSRSIFEKLIYFGIATFFLWPFVQLWSVKALPLVDSDVHLRATVALENILEESLSRPFAMSSGRVSFEPVSGYDDIGLSGRVEVMPHPDLPATALVKAQVRWGYFPFAKILTLEYVRARTRP